MDARVQGLDAATQQLGHLGQVLDEGHRDADLLQEARGAAGRDQLDVELREAARKRLEALLVVDREQRPPDHEISSRTTCGSSLCSTA